VQETGLSDLSCYCPGCFIQLGGAAKNIGVETHYSLEEILWAFGDEYPIALKERTAVQSKLFMNRLETYLRDAGPDRA
jgi:hypothetical protein